MSAAEILFTDLKRAIADRDPEAADLVVRYLEQPDPKEDRPEAADPKAEVAPLPAGTWSAARLRTTVQPNLLEGKSPEEQKATRLEAWQGLQDAPYHPPRLDLGPLLIELYEGGEPWARQLLMDVFTRARLGWGIWQAFKRIYKLSEVRHDLAMFGVLAWRLDVLKDTAHNPQEILPGTILYMRRRAWRYLRQLGHAVPDLYPQFAVQVLRHYQANQGSFARTWIAGQIWGHENLKGVGSGVSGMWQPPDKLDRRFLDAAWKRSAEPVLRLLEDAQNDVVCAFAIRCLEADFPDKKKDVDPAWLRRIGTRPLGSVHGFVVRLLEDSPKLHHSKLAELGLAEMVIGFLESPNDAARKYAIEYARGYAPALPVELLVRLMRGPEDAQRFAQDRLQAMTPAAIGLENLVRLLQVDSGQLARAKVQEGFKPTDLSAEQFVRLFLDSRKLQAWVLGFFSQAKVEVPARFYTAVLEDPACGWRERNEAVSALSKRTAQEIGVEWIKDALMRRDLQRTVSDWLRGGLLAGDALDVEWVKGLVMRPSLRGLAIELLANPKLVAPARIGLPWLLAMTRQPDEALSGFAHRYLLEHFTPEDIGGIDRLWALATGKREPEAVRSFAATYLKVHHPVLGPTLPEAKALGIKPRLGPEAYALARVRPCFSDERADVRRLGAAIGKQEMVGWGDAGLVYALADSRFKESRALAALALFGIGDKDAELTPPASWVDAPRLFALAESDAKATREIALTLIRRHYDTVGSAHRLAWLMESPDREVRLFAVRLFWERHRPRAVPASWTPKKGKAAGAPEPFDSVEALRLFLRTVMFGLPPGRMERRELSDDATPERALPASVAKRRMIEAVRDLATEDAAFALVVVPVLDEFMRSAAKGEWQSCVSALARIRRAHPEITTALPQAVNR
ncbi:MAG: hypothetical protein KC933_21905 [Myxococcales bacterium]|nr:hypothetical protein [Myxococcales bacterium]MCB9650308.1 hypothetical protein [Deltaproteobacteria bacterium]